MSDDDKFSLRENASSLEAFGSTIYHFIKSKDIIRTALAGYATLGSLITAMQDLIYQSYAAFIGEIKIIVSTYKEQYTFRGTYNIFGNKDGEYETGEESDLMY